MTDTADTDLAPLTTLVAQTIHDTYASASCADPLQRVVELVAQVVDGCEWASVSDERARTVVSSGEVSRTADELQHRLGEGPCLSAANDNSDFYLFDVETDNRWPALRSALLEQTPVRSVLALPLRADSVALNLSAARPGAFDPEAITRATVLSAHVSALVALQQAELKIANLERALDNSRTIGTAMGVLMHAHRITREQAFALLRDASMALHRKLASVAEDVVETGTLPGDFTSRKD